jgi:hypothetical protein
MWRERHEIGATTPFLTGKQNHQISHPAFMLC